MRNYYFKNKFTSCILYNSNKKTLIKNIQDFELLKQKNF